MINELLDISKSVFSLFMIKRRNACWKEASPGYATWCKGHFQESLQTYWYRIFRWYQWVITVKYHLNSYTCPSVKHCLNNKSVFSLKAEESLHSTRCWIKNFRLLLNNKVLQLVQTFYRITYFYFKEICDKVAISWSNWLRDI